MITAAVARLRQLSAAGVEGQALVPVLLNELHRVVPSYSNTFLWFDDGLRVSNAYDESPDGFRLGPLYLREFFPKRAVEARLDVLKWIRQGGSLTTTNEYARRNFYRSAFYNEILRPVGYHHSAMLVVRHEGRPFGFLALNRQRTDPPFRARELRLLAGIGPHIGQALQRKTDWQSLATAGEDTGLIVLNERAQVEYSSQEGRRLLFFATHPVINGDTPDTAVAHARVPLPVEQLCRQLIDTAKSPPGPAAPAVWEHRNAWGSFVFRAHLLARSGGGGWQVGLTVQQQVPIAVRLLRAAERLGLTPRQTHMCLLLLRGHSYEEVAAELHLSPHTVVDHRRRLYEKLGVKDRSELVQTILASAALPSISSA